MTGPAIPWLVLQLGRELSDGDHVHIGAGQSPVIAAVLLARAAYGRALRITVAGTHLLRSDASIDCAALAFDRDVVRAADVVFEQERYFDDVGRLPIVFSTGFQVDELGNGNMIGFRAGPGDTWRVRGPGFVGIPSLTGHATRLRVYLREHSVRTLVRRVEVISMVGDPHTRQRLGLGHPVEGSVVTPIARFRWAEDGLVLAGHHPDLTVEQVWARTGFSQREAPELSAFEPATAAERTAFETNVMPALAGIDWSDW